VSLTLTHTPNRNPAA